MLDFKKEFVPLMIFGLATPGILHAATGEADVEPWWFFMLELFGLFLIIFLVISFFGKLPDKNLPAKKGVRKMFINNIIGFSLLGITLIVRSYFETQGVQEFNGDLIFEAMLYLSLPFFIIGIIGYHDEDSNTL